MSTHIEGPPTGVGALGGGGGFDFDEERPTKRFVGLVFGWDWAPVCGWVGFVGYPNLGLVEVG